MLSAVGRLLRADSLGHATRDARVAALRVRR